MNKQERIKELDRLGKVAGIKKYICGLMPSLGKRVRTLNTQYTQLSDGEKDLIRPQLDNALDKVIDMVKKINHNFQEEEKKQITIEQLKEKVEAIVGPEESAGAEGFEVEVHEQDGTKSSN
jgi:hypothetical protein